MSVKVDTYVRTDEEPQGTYLGLHGEEDWDQLISLMGRWGLHAEGQDWSDIVGQFFVRKGKAGFELIAVSAD